MLLCQAKETSVKQKHQLCQLFSHRIPTQAADYKKNGKRGCHGDETARTCWLRVDGRVAEDPTAQYSKCISLEGGGTRGCHLRDSFVEARQKRQRRWK
jgi:hypothetical protein